MKKYSVWYMPYNKKYLLTHPWQWFKCAWRNVRDAWRRSVYGWTYGDVWDWYEWFLHITPEMLRYMADHGSAYPGHEPFTTPEKWHDWLHEIADLLESGTEEWQEVHNEYYDEYIKQLRNEKWTATVDENGMHRFVVPERTELDEKYFARMQELSKQGEDNVRRGLSLVGEHIYDCWD